MCRNTHSAKLTPGGLAVDWVEIGAAKIIVTARLGTKMGTCPECGAVSGRIHSRYKRRLMDLPAHGRVVEINVETRRFRCVGAACRRRIFVQRLGDAVALPSARRTARMDSIVHRLGLALGGRPGHNLASRLAIPVSKDTLLRTVRRRAARPREPLRAVGIDDWAWRKGCQYGTVICDLERRTSLRSCRIVRVAPVLPGCAVTPASSSLPEIVARATATPHQGERPRLHKSLIVGISSKTPARAFLTSCGRICTQSVNRRRLTASTPHCLVVPSASGGRISNTARRRSTRCCNWSNGEPHSNRLPDGLALRARRSDASPEEAEWRFSAAA